MKVLLMVTPPENVLELEISDEMARHTGFFPPLGLLYLATYMKHNSKHDVLVVDGESEQLSLKAIEQRLLKIQPDVLGITAFTHTLRSVLDAIKLAKRVLPDCKIVLGGPHIALYPVESVEFEDVDYCVMGEGERSFLELVNLLEKKLPLEAHEQELVKIEGIVFKKADGRVHKNGFARIPELDALPFPDRGFVDKSSYFCILGKNRLMTTVMSSRGCPFQCTFCNTPDHTYRYRSPINVVNEMEMLAKDGIEEIFFFDDLFNINSQRVIEICDEILRRNVKVKWAFRGRVRGITDELAKKCAMAGCERIQYGIEKGTDKMLKKLNKNVTVTDVVNAVKLTKKYGMMAVGNFLLFTPGEDEKDAEEDIRFALSLPLDHAEFNVFIPYPGTRIYSDGLRSGFFERDYWAEFARNPDPDFQLVWEEKVKKEKMYQINAMAHKRFYLRPRIVFNELMRISSWKDFTRIANGAKVILNLGFRSSN